MTGRSVTIIGAGIGGLTAAIALARRGAQVWVLEAADAVRAVGAGLQISPNGMAVFAALGLEERVAAVSVTCRDVGLVDGLTAKPVVRLDLGALATSHPWCLVHRGDLVSILADVARDAGVTFSFGRRVRDVRPHDDGVTLTFSDGTADDADIAVAADGIGSVAAPVLDAPAPHFTGQVAWRAIVSAPAPSPTGVRVFMGPGRHLVAYPLRGGAETNIVAVQERDAWAAEGWQQTDDPANLRAAFADFALAAGRPAARPRQGEVGELLEQVTETNLWGLYRRPVGATWWRGRLVALGDAVHSTLPFLAQGACMAIEDAWVLADSLSTREPDAAFAAYQAARRDRCRRIVAAADRNAKAYHLRAPLRAPAHAVLRLGERVAPNAALRRFAWLYEHDVTA